MRSGMGRSSRSVNREHPDAMRYNPMCALEILRHGLKDTEFESIHALLVGAVNLPMLRPMEPPLILPMDSRLRPRSRARANVAQTHRFLDCLQALHF
jgi:hypothetical protein